MGCGASTDGAPAVLPNTVTQNGRSAHNNPPFLDKDFDLNLKDPELEEAATKIQAAFRGHQTRNKLKEQKMAQEEEVIDIDLNDPEVGHAATKIQASFRGHKARKEAKKQKDESELSEELEKLKTNKEEADELEGIDLTDPELNKAATKIQAQFRGHTEPIKFQRSAPMSPLWGNGIQRRPLPQYSWNGTATAHAFPFTITVI